MGCLPSVPEAGELRSGRHSNGKRGPCNGHQLACMRVSTPARFRPVHIASGVRCAAALTVQENSAEVQKNIKSAPHGPSVLTSILFLSKKLVFQILDCAS